MEYTTKKKMILNKKIILKIFIPFLFLISCHTQINEDIEETYSVEMEIERITTDPIDIKLFLTYLDEFKTTQLPLSIDKDFLSENVIISNKLDSVYNPFIDKEIMQNAQMDYPYTHFAVMKFNVSESKIGLVVKKQGIAGGVEDYYFLHIFSDEGVLLSKTTIAQYTSECSYETITTCEISKRLEVTLLTMEYSGDCFGDSLELKNSTVKKLFIEESGVVK